MERLLCKKKDLKSLISKLFSFLLSQKEKKKQKKSSTIHCDLNSLTIMRWFKEKKWKNVGTLGAIYKIGKKKIVIIGLHHTQHTLFFSFSKFFFIFFFFFVKTYIVKILQTL